MPVEHDKDKELRDKLISDYDSILRESGLLTTFSGILFGFLLNMSVNANSDLDSINRALLLIALFSITVSISLFVMPVVYHHIQYPYRDFEKFKARSHRFIIFGLAPAGITLYLGLEIALSFVLSWVAFFIASVPFVLVYILFRLRK